MGRFSKVLRLLGVAVAVLLIGMGVGWLATRRGGSETLRVPPDTRPPNSRPAVTSVFKLNPRPAPPVPATNPSVVTSAPPPRTNLLTNWEDKLDEILGSDAQESDKAKQLLAIFPRLPEDGQLEVAQHLSNLVPDQEYGPLGNLLADPKSPESVLDVLMVDVLNRPNGLKLPLLLEIARDSQHPKAPEAKDLLELYLEQDYGNDWTKWEAKMKQWIQENPD